MPRVLIIAYGNPMRSDDGLAWRAADQLDGKFSSGDVEIFRLHQLAPEIAEAASRSHAVIFVDAACAPGSSPGDLWLASVLRNEEAPRFSHQLSPSAVMALAHRLYDATPRAFSLTLAGQNFEHGEELSPVVSRALPELVAEIEILTRQLLQPPAAQVDSR